MSTEDLSKKLSTLQAILSSKYSAFGIVAFLYYLFGKLPPQEAAQAQQFIKSLNNPVGWFIGVYLILEFINKAFFQKYIDEKISYTSALQEIRMDMKSFTEKCIMPIDRMGHIEDMLVESLAIQVEQSKKFTEHDKQVADVFSLMENRFIPAFEAIKKKFADEL
jgi:hypothetical protein